MAQVDEGGSVDGQYEVEYLMAKINSVLVSIGILINIFHFFILIQKELRTLSVFILMIGVCFCDIIYLLTSMIHYLDVIRAYRRTDYCYSYDSLLMSEILRWVNSAIYGSEFASVCLVVVMAFFRSLTITFPLNKCIARVTSVKTTCLVMFVVIVVGWVWSVWPFFSVFKMHKWTEKDICSFIEDITTTESDQYRLVYYAEDMPLLNLLVYIDIGIRSGQIVIYVFFGILLMLSIRKTRRNQRRMSHGSGSIEERKIDTTKLVLAMTLVFLSTQMFQPLSEFIYLERSKEGVAPSTLERMFLAIVACFKIVHSSSHCLITYFMSSQYQDTVRRVLAIPKKSKHDVMVGPHLHK